MEQKRFGSARNISQELLRDTAIAMLNKVTPSRLFAMTMSCGFWQHCLSVSFFLSIYHNQLFAAMHPYHTHSTPHIAAQHPVWLIIYPSMNGAPVSISPLSHRGSCLVFLSPMNSAPSLIILLFLYRFCLTSSLPTISPRLLNSSISTEQVSESGYFSVWFQDELSRCQS